MKNEILFTGRWLDKSTNLYYYRARWYDAEDGRFVSKDPIGFDSGDWNLYRYVGNNSVRYIDSYGNWKACYPWLSKKLPWIKVKGPYNIHWKGIAVVNKALSIFGPTIWIKYGTIDEVQIVIAVSYTHLTLPTKA